MSEVINKIIVAVLALIFVSVLAIAATAEALEPNLLWKKDFKYTIESVDLAYETGEVIAGLGGSEVILFDKAGKERFHWGPRIDRAGGGVKISKDGQYFVFSSGYGAEYAEKKGVPWWEDIRIHFYSGRTKKELWNRKTAECDSLISPDGSFVINDCDPGGFEMLNPAGNKIAGYDQPIWGLASFMFTPDSGYFAVVGDSMQPLMLFRRDGTKLWEKGRHGDVASISEGASYISTYPYSLGLSYGPDSKNTHLGSVYDRNGNIIMEGFGVLSGNGARIAMLYPDKISIFSLPDKTKIMDIPIQLNFNEIESSPYPYHIKFSHDGRYLVVKSGSSVVIFDLIADIKKEIVISNLGIIPSIFLTRDGRYLLIYPYESKTLYYYQLY